jgi:hypothetical protein
MSYASDLRYQRQNKNTFRLVHDGRNGRDPDHSHPAHGILDRLDVHVVVHAALCLLGRNSGYRLPIRTGSRGHASLLRSADGSEPCGSSRRWRLGYADEGG